MSEVFGVLKSAIATQWPHVEPWIVRALEQGNGEYEPADIRAQAEDGRVQLWAFLHDGEIVGAAVTQVVQYPRRKAVSLFLGAAKDGLRDQWLPWLEGIEAWASVAIGADAIEVKGRKGWARVLPPDYVHERVVMRKGLK